jgi:GDP-L-fucose synthase
MTQPLLFDLRGKRVYVAGHNGMVGAAIVRRLASEQCEILTIDRAKLDLTDQRATEDYLQRERPDAIFLAAGLVGGIYANNSYPADFIAINLAIALNVIRAAHAIGVKKLLALGSSCIYPKLAPQPMSESAPRSSRPTSGMRSPRSRPLSCARLTASSMAAISFR